MGKDAPTPPNPFLTAQAQTGTNVSTAVANAYLSQVNQNTPEGALSYAPTNSYQWTDPTSGQTYTIPTFTATQTLSPMNQAIKDQSQYAQYHMAAMANQQSDRISGLLSKGIDVTGAPSAGNASNILGITPANTSYSAGGPLATTYGPADDFSADRQRVENALMARMNPQLQIEQQRVQQQLADQGIRYGSQAYSDAMMNYSRQANDARFGAIGQAGQEQQRLMDMAAQRAGFQNQAQQQQYQQNALLAQFGNAGLAQQMQQQQAGFNAAQAARNQYLQETYALRNQPINEITALLSGAQVQQPNFINTPGAQIPTTDVAGLINQNFNQQFQNYQQQSTNQNALIGGVLGLGAGALKASDERVKENIVPMGSVFADSDDHKLPIYQYSYKGDPSGVRHTGPMAQDVEKLDPKAVKSIGGVKHIDTRRVMGSILRAS
jgi:Chaperone of endosialidase